MDGAHFIPVIPALWKRFSVHLQITNLARGKELENFFIARDLRPETVLWGPNLMMLLCFTTQTDGRGTRNVFGNYIKYMVALNMVDKELVCVFQRKSTTHEEKHSATTRERRTRRAVLNAAERLIVVSINSLRNVSHREGGENSTPLLSRAQTWPFYCFYINVFCRAELLRQKSTKCEGWKEAINMLKTFMLCEKELQYFRSCGCSCTTEIFLCK